jgi:hypothetical protein
MKIEINFLHARFLQEERSDFPTSPKSHKLSWVFTEKIENYKTQNIEKMLTHVLKHIQNFLSIFLHFSVKTRGNL